MLELLTTDDFARWFSELAAGPAEDVAATLEVIVQLGSTTEAPGSSELLLWYEHPLVSQGHIKVGIPSHLPPEVARFMQEYGRFSGYLRRVIKHLESKPFLARLARLSAADADAIGEAVAQIRRLAWQRPMALSDYRLKKMRGRITPTTADSVALARFVDVSEIRECYFKALRAAGFEVVDVPPTSCVLREISLRSTAPGLRLLYGIDQPRNRGLVVLGEWLDRSFYGDAVRHAEAVWGQFLEGRSLSTQPATAR